MPSRWGSPSRDETVLSNSTAANHAHVEWEPASGDPDPSWNGELELSSPVLEEKSDVQHASPALLGQLRELLRLQQARALVPGLRMYPNLTRALPAAVEARCRRRPNYRGGLAA